MKNDYIILCNINNIISFKKSSNGQTILLLLLLLLSATDYFENWMYFKCIKCVGERQGVRENIGIWEAIKLFIWLLYFLFKLPWPICCSMPAIISYDPPTGQERLFQHKRHRLDVGPKAFIYLSGLRLQFVITQGIMYYACAQWWHHNSRMKYKLWYG